MAYEIELKEQKPQPTLSIRTKTSVDKLPKLIGESYMKIVGYLTELGQAPACAPFTAYHNLDMQNLDVEMGFPVSQKLPGKEGITAGEIPEGPVVTCMYKGAYSGMENVYNEMFKWISDKGYVPAGVYYEYYFNSPMEVPESELLTRVDLPVKKK